VVGAVLTAVSTMSLFWASALRDKYADEQISGAQATAELARTEQTRLQVDLEREKVARAQFEAQFSWRIINDNQKSILVAALSKSPHVVAVEFPAGDQEATFLALQFIEILKHAGWKVAPRSVPSAPLFWGLDVPGPSNDAVKELRSALTAAKMAVGTDNLPVPGVFLGSDEGNKLLPECRLVIGAKMTTEVRRILSRQHSGSP
jgi:hypothetical protein